MRVHLLEPLEPALEARLLAAAPQLELSTGDEVAADVEVLVAGVPRAEQLDASSRLRALVIPWSGLPLRTARLLEGRGLTVHNIHHNARAVAEMAMALLLAVAKRVVPCDQDLRAGRWRRGEVGLELADRRALIAGMGAIGRYLAPMLRGLGLEVRGLRRQGGEPAGEIATIGPGKLDAALPQTQVLITALPSTAATQGLFDERRLGLLPEDAVVVNVGRAAVIDERALFFALRDRWIWGAGLDVWWRYPRSAPVEMPSAYPYGELDNLVLSPHRAGRTERNEADRTDHLATLLTALAAGDTSLGRVNLAHGY